AAAPRRRWTWRRLCFRLLPSTGAISYYNDRASWSAGVFARTVRASRPNVSLPGETPGRCGRDGRTPRLLPRKTRRVQHRVHEQRQRPAPEEAEVRLIREGDHLPFPVRLADQVHGALQPVDIDSFRATPATSGLSFTLVPTLSTV